MKTATEANRESNKSLELKYEKEIPQSIREEVEKWTEEAIKQGKMESVIEITGEWGCDFHIEWCLRCWFHSMGYKTETIERTLKSFIVKWTWED